MRERKPPPTAEAQLQAKYSELSRKYAALVDRLDRRAEDRIGQRIGYLGLQASAHAIGKVSKGKLRPLSSAWASLALTSGRRWTSEADGTPPRSYDNLETLAIREAARLTDRGLAGITVRFQAGRGNSLLDVRLERTSTSPRADVIVLVQDVSGSESGESRESLLQRDRLRLLGVLAASVAHDLGTTLRAGVMHLEMLKEPGAVLAERAGAVEGVALALAGASETVSKLHDFARAGQLVLGPVDLGGMVRQAVAVVALQQHGRPAVSFQIELPALPPVRGSTAELSHLLVNLLMNAAESMADGGTVRVGATHLDGRVQLTIADQGGGMAPEVRARLFEPFFTTKGAGGTGLGLWLAATTVRRIGGTIVTESEPGEGTTFRIEFPVAATFGGREALPAALPASPRAQARRALPPPRAPAPPGPVGPAARQKRPGRRSGRRT